MEERPPAGSAALPDHPLTPEAFISYARIDKALVRPLHDQLTERKRDIWVDWEDIRPSETFMQAIEQAIEVSNVFVFIISPDSVHSIICRQELDHAVLHGKKLIPIVCRDVAADLVPAPLASLDWIFARTADDISGAVDRLCSAFDTDLEWVRTHTRLLVRAVEWDRNGRNRSFLLQGVDLDRAERALAQVPPDRVPRPTMLQHEYLLASRRWSSRRLRIVAASVTVGLAVAIVLGWLANQQRREAEAATLRGLSRQLAAQSELVRRPVGEPLTLSVLLAAESLRHYPSLEGDLAMRRGLALLPRPAVYVEKSQDVSVVKLSPDGRLLATVRKDGSIAVIDMHTGRPIATLTQPPPTSLVWSPDAHYLLTADEQGSVRIWSIERRSTIAGFQIEKSAGPVAFSADGNRVAVTDEDETGGVPGTVRIWDLANNREVAQFMPGLPVQAVALNSTGRQATILEASFFSTKIEVRKEPFKKAIAEEKLNGHVSFPRFDATGTLLAFVNRISHIGGGVSGQQEVTVYAIEQEASGEAIRLESTTLRHPCDVNGIEFSPEAHRIVTTCEDNTVRGWSPAEGRPVAQLTAPGRIAGFAVGPEAATVAIRGEDDFVHLFALLNATHVTSVHQPDVRELALSEDGRYLTLVDDEGSSGVWEAAGGSAAHHMVLPADVRSVHFSPDDSMVAVCTEEGAELFRLRLDTAAVPLRGAGNALACAFSADGKQFFTVSASGIRGGAGPIEVIGDDDIRIWDAATGRLLNRRQRPPSSDMAVSDNGGYIAISEPGGRITIAELAGGRVVRTLNVRDRTTSPVSASNSAPGAAPPRIVTSLCFNPAGDHLAVVYEERRAQVWDVASGSAGPVIDLSGRGYILNLSPRGRSVITASMETISSHAQLWDAVTGHPTTLGAPDEFFNRIVFGPDGSLVATIAGEHSVQVWNLEQRRLLISMVHPEIVYQIAFNPAGTHIATGSADQNARVWEIASGREMSRMTYDFSVFGLLFNASGTQLAVPGGPQLWLEFWRPEDLLDAAGLRVERNLTRDEWGRYLPDAQCRPTFPLLRDGCIGAAADSESVK